MNLLYLKYAVEVAKTTSITKAAEALYMGQPNLSRAIKDLEEELGIKIFKRTSKGIVPTEEGEEFLGYARSILSQVDAMERMYKGERANTQLFSASVPRATYISCAFTDFVKSVSGSERMEILYRETNSLRAINNIVEAGYRIGIIRYQSAYDRYFKAMLAEKGLASELICEFSHVALMSEKNPLSGKKSFRSEELAGMTEIAHGDPFVPNLPQSEARKSELSEYVDKHIFVFERGSQFGLLEQLPDAFMWVSPIPKRILEQHHLVTRPCEDDHKVYRDVLIYRKNYRLTDLDCQFIDSLTAYKREVLGG